MSTTLKLIGLFGILLFGILFSVTFVSPEKVEGSARGFVKSQIEKEIRERQQTMSESSVAEAALNIAGRLGLEKDKMQADLDNKLPEKIASIVAVMCGYDCEKKKALTQSIATSYMERIKSIKIAENTLDDVVKGKYLEIVGNLKFDLRIFLGSNFAMFLILVAISFLKPRAVQHLFLPGLLLVVATIVASCIYIFGQDWFYTILYNDYMGFGYLLYIVIIFGFLLDITFNKARVTCEIINGIANAIGSAFSVVPC
ncbi:hypothetical protein [Simiduia agarivorans]|uniref:Uncharacterized protein n=1 Tax=Simiduia agarivorans (strain DSM 21679 / JCM 13881 / BCRC 17597 / SA1) TaxID=1117647 RepID=K4L160_SIMAS|nr:hypothetical protein [Simiduia agarivorans]AFU99912.1 hypothetical protein M5M_13870 [Simiduia agarivorans SA1 = DSM 21679]